MTSDSKHRAGLLTVAGLFFALWSGCSRSIENVPVAVVPAGGTLTYRSQPVAGAQLILHNDELPEPAFAVTDAGGRFECLTNDSSDGIPAGEYVVTISSAGGKIPERYTAVESSPLHITVEHDADNQFALEVQD